MIARCRIAPPNLRPAPSSITPAIADRLIALADMIAQAPAAAAPQPGRQPTYPFLDHRTAAELARPQSSPLDASFANSGRTGGEVHPARIAAVEAGCDIPSGEAHGG